MSTRSAEDDNNTLAYFLASALAKLHDGVSTDDVVAVLTASDEDRIRVITEVAHKWAEWAAPRTGGEVADIEAQLLRGVVEAEGRSRNGGASTSGGAGGGNEGSNNNGTRNVDRPMTFREMMRIPAKRAEFVLASTEGPAALAALGEKWGEESYRNWVLARVDAILRRGY